MFSAPQAKEELHEHNVIRPVRAIEADCGIDVVYCLPPPNLPLVRHSDPPRVQAILVIAKRASKKLAACGYGL